MRRSSRAASAVVALLVFTSMGAAALPPLDASAPDACHAGDAGDAAAALVEEHASVTGVAQIAGLEVATAVDWRVPPGIPNALLRVGDAWCTTVNFNAAAAERLGGAGAATLASAFASVAGMQYLGEVEVTRVVAIGPVVTLTTVGGRHGAVSAWTVTTDAHGISEASFATTGWSPERARGAHDQAHDHGGVGGVGGVDHEDHGGVGDLEGITSLPGHTRTFTRAPDGLVRIDATVDDLWETSLRDRAAAVARAGALAGDPVDELSHTFEDGLTVKVSYGMSPLTPDPGIDTGVAQADRLRTIFSGMIDHYEDFMRWGVEDPFGYSGRPVLGSDTGLPHQAGYINVDSPLAPVCLACAFLADAIEVHILLLFPEVVHALININYPDHEKFVQTVIGHEMVHSLQGGYANGSAASAFTNAYIEGVARASESLHDIAWASHHPGSIHYVNNGNGCQGFHRGQTWIQQQSTGPFNGHSYDGCYFWWTYFAAHGPEVLVALLEAQLEALATSSGNAAARNIRLLEVASLGGDAALELARWGAAVAAGNDADGYAIPAGRTGDRLNWFAHLQPAQRAVTLSATQEVTVSNGGFRAYHVEQPGTVAALPDGAVAYAFANVDRELVPSLADVGTQLEPGQILVLVAPAAASFSGTVAVEPG